MAQFLVVRRMHMTLNRPSLAIGRVKWLSVPAVVLTVWSLVGILMQATGWLLLGGLFISPICFICSLLVLSHVFVATGRTLFRAAVVVVNIVGLAFASLWLISLIFNVYA